MSYPDMKCMIVNVWIHHMQIDEMFDFLSGRIDTPPPYWYNQEECPYTVTGGYAMISLDYAQFSNLRSVQDWADPFTEWNQIDEEQNIFLWKDINQDSSDNGVDDHEDYVDL